MSTPGPSPLTAAQSVRDSLAAADRRRRIREASGRIWRAAQIGASCALAAAALGYLLGWPPALPLGILAALFLGLMVAAMASRRRRPLTDAVAAAIDADAGMRGELRSASWFAVSDRRDAWADHHVLRAADRLAGLDWTAVYPAPRPGREQLATAAIAVLAILLSITIPERVQTAASPASDAAGAAAAASAAAHGVVLSPELVRRLQDLLAAAERGDAKAAGTLANDQALREMLDRLATMNDAELLKQLADAVAQEAGKPPARNAMQELADRARQAAESGGLSSAMQDALEQLADELEVARPDLARSASDDGEPSEGGGGAQAESGGGGSDGKMPDGQMQFARDADAGGGAGVLMMSEQQGGQGGGMPGGGTGGAGSEHDTAEAMAGIEAALKQELVQASQDKAGDQVDSEIRRRTEAGDATVAFTGSASGTFDRARAAAPPPVPEARRSGVQRYFVRESQYFPERP